MKVIPKYNDGLHFATIKVGKNAVENVKLFDEALQDDLWFHLDSGPSSHVWLHMENGLTLENIELTKRKSLIRECGVYVAENSKCGGRNVKICYLEKKHLKRDKEKLGTVYLQKKPEVVIV